MRINIKELLDFFDGKKGSQKGDANAIMAVLGEDLNASVYKHFRKDEVEVLEDSVLPGTSRGKRLDRWILDKKNNTLIQCEIKNWAATAIGGRRLMLNASKEDTRTVTEYYWKRELNNNLSSKVKHPNIVTKVLLRMKPPEKYRNILKIEPLLIYWMLISSDARTLNPLSTISVKSLNLSINTMFSELNIFSVSLYLRQLYKRGAGRNFIDLDMPHFRHRTMLLDKFRK